MDIYNLLSYQFRNERGFVKTANLEDVYNKFKNKSHINAIYYKSLIQWMNSFLKKVEKLNDECKNIIFMRQLDKFVNNVWWFLRYDHGDLNDGSKSKEDIYRVIHEYHLAFDLPDVKLIDSDKVPMPVIQKEIKLVYQEWIERIPYLTYKKGHRGFVRDYDYRYYPGSVPDLLSVNE